MLTANALKKVISLISRRVNQILEPALHGNGFPDESLSTHLSSIP